MYPVEINVLTDNFDGVREACGNWIPVFRCPSSADPESVSGEWWANGIEGRVPCNYLGCGSGTSARESGDSQWCGDPDSDGIMARNLWVTLQSVTDGLSTTVMYGETTNVLGVFAPDDSGNPQHVDHWYIWSEELTLWDSDLDFAESSEAVGSTAARINAIDIEDAHINEKELCFSSRHKGRGINLAFCDGHVQFVSATIDAETYSAIGTRNGNEIVDEFD